MGSDRFLCLSIVCLIGIAISGDSASIDWIAQGSNQDLDSPANWSPSTVPGSSDIAIFNSALSGICTTPIEGSSPFTVSSFQFPNSASNFHFNFNNQTLNFSGPGITGTNKDPTIAITNRNNLSFISHLIDFQGVTGSVGKAQITSSNVGTLPGSSSGVSSNIVGANLRSTSPFLISNGAFVNASNSGIDQTTGMGGNVTCVTTSDQLSFTQSFTAENHVTVYVSNSGTCSGSSSSAYNNVGLVQGTQFISTGAFNVGDYFISSVSNLGEDSSSGHGGNSIGFLYGSQMILQSTAHMGNSCQFIVSNTGTNSSDVTTSATSIGYLNDQQFLAGHSFQAGNDFSLMVTNSGIDTSTGVGGASVGYINSNSGTTGQQVFFQRGCSLGDRGAISVTNSGQFSGTYTANSQSVGSMNLEQILFGDEMMVGSYTFRVGDDFSLTVTNSGLNSSHGIGGASVGNVSTDQLKFNTPCSVGANGSFTVSNTGNFSGSASTTYLTSGSMGGSQLYAASTFDAGDDFTLQIDNSGTLTGTGIGGYFIGNIQTGQSANFQERLTIGHRGTIHLSNSGSNSSSTTNSNYVGYFGGYGKQLYLKELFLADNDLEIVISNSGQDQSTMSNGNQVGSIGNNSADKSGSQIHLGGGASWGDRASITLTNSGTFQGHTNLNQTGGLAGHQFYSVASFEAGDDFNLNVSNSGLSEATGHSQNSIAVTGGGLYPQIEFGDTCVLGNDAIITVLNSGINRDATGIENFVGYCNEAQLKMGGLFSSGTNLTITATNESTNLGDNTNYAGYVSGSQILFDSTCALASGAQIIATNSGNVVDSQIKFMQGFDVASGQVLIQTSNTGQFGVSSINIQGASGGGNAKIFMENGFLKVETSLPTFTIAELVGDGTSRATSQPTLVIQTEASAAPEFAGVISDFPEATTNLTKTGAGSQILSGTNTFTGLTTVQEGTLIVTGSLAGSVSIEPSGILKGGGTIGGTIINTGTVAPGESIGTMNTAAYVNNGGNYEAEVNGLGQSDLIHATGTATLNGGLVIVSSVDRTFRYGVPYTIITADGGLMGPGFSGATSLALITPTLTTDATHLYLTLASNLLSAAETCNQIGVAANLDAIANSGVQNQLIGSIAGLTREDAQKSLDSLSGFQYTDEMQLAEAMHRRFMRSLYDPLRPLVIAPEDSPCRATCDDWTFWLEPTFAASNFHGKNAHRVHSDSFQIIGGVQKSFCSDFTIGLAGSYEYDSLNYTDALGNRYVEFGAVYGLYRPDLYYLLFDLIYEHASTDVTRSIYANYLQYKANGTPQLNAFSSYGEVGFDLDARYLLIQPFLGLEYGENWRSKIDESQPEGLALAVKEKSWTTAASRLGLHLSSLKWGNVVQLSLDTAWNQLWSTHTNSAKGRFQEFGDPYKICGNNLGSWSIDYALTLITTFCLGLNGSFRVGGESWGHGHTVDVQGALELTW